MARIERSWNHDFQSYMEDIVRHPNYEGLPIERKRDGTLSWIATAKSKMGKARKVWAENKARELGLPVQSGVYAQVMREIHPTKQHICQICGSSMSIYYHYPSVNFLKSLKKEFGFEFSECDHIEDIWEQILETDVDEDSLHIFFKHKFKLSNIDDAKKDDIIVICERMCRIDGNKHLSPGVMSNFPDRYDGFHSYNRCCRAEQDKGRSRENLKSYTKDRRAYEYWSDGNLHAANMFMGSGFFEGVSADHIGPISLGFVHDPHYLRPMSFGDNSTKRDRLLVEDINEILDVESATGVYPMSWYSSDICEFIKENYIQHANIVSTHFRDILKQNMTNFMFVLKTIIDKTEELGEAFLYNELIAPKADSFEHVYNFESDGSFTMTPRHRTERSANEFERFKRIALTAVTEYSEKTNRNINPDLSHAEKLVLNKLCEDLASGASNSHCRKKLNDIMVSSQSRLMINVSALYLK